MPGIERPTSSGANQAVCSRSLYLLLREKRRKSTKLARFFCLSPVQLSQKKAQRSSCRQLDELQIEFAGKEVFQFSRRSRARREGPLHKSELVFLFPSSLSHGEPSSLKKRDYFNSSVPLLMLTRRTFLFNGLVIFSELLVVVAVLRWHICCYSPSA